MTVPEILKELEPYTGRFPKRAVQAAIEQRDAITPELLRVLENAAENPIQFVQRKDYMLHIFALYLLAQFREKRAYLPIVKMFSAPGETPFELAGDTVTERLKRIFASVYDGDPVPLQNLIEDEQANEYVRDSAIDAFVVLKDSGQMVRETVVSYFQSLFRGRLKRQHSHAWNGLVCAVADLPAPELLDDLRQAYTDDLVDPGFAGLDELERDLRGGGRPFRETYTLITDAIAEMEWWAAFHPDNKWPKKRVRLPDPPAQTTRLSPPPVRRVKIGRNDPCPCGSGKKFKKCCGKN